MLSAQKEHTCSGDFTHPTPALWDAALPGKNAELEFRLVIPTHPGQAA